MQACVQLAGATRRIGSTAVAHVLNTRLWCLDDCSKSVLADEQALVQASELLETN